MATHQFGQVFIRASEVFCRSPLSLAFVNLKPIAPGHVLVIPRRRALRMADLTPAEVSDLFLLGQRVGAGVEKFFEATSLTFAVQDGAEAGQTISHVHLHIIPRRKGDWANNDDIYSELQGTSKRTSVGVDSERPPRTRDVMAEEARALRVHFGEPDEP